jgi:glucosylceramidase
MHFKTILLSLIIGLTACGKAEKVQVLSSLPNTDSLLIETQIPIGEKLKENIEIIRISTSDSCQTVLGVGAALTHASAWVFHHNLTPTLRDSLFRNLFTAQGIGINYTRLCVGASDFSFNLFSYSETEDFTLSNFSIDEDYKDVIPMLHEILAINPDIQIMASPWSPPAWMKTNKSMVGGKLRTDCYGVYADYLIKYIEAYKKEGIKIHTMTVQNEPEFGTAAYPCMDMTAEEQKAFIRGHLGPKLEAAGLDTKIVLFDHNCDNPDYPISILNDSLAKQYVDGSGFHLYKGNVTALCKVHEAHPDRNIYFTEQSGGGWAPDFDQNVRWYVGELFVGAMNCWSKNALLWNLALDENNGPKNFGCQDCYGVVEINKAGEIKKHAEYYALAHYGKYIQPNAKRLVSIGDALKGAAFLNPDGTMVYMAVYYGKKNKEIQIQADKKTFSYTFRPGEVISFKWKN